MSPVSPESVLAQLNWRYAAKKFDPAKKIASELWSQLERAVVLAPSSYGLQPWKFFVVANPDVRLELQKASWNQPQIVDASHLVVFAVKKGMNPSDAERHVRRVAEVRGVPLAALDGYKQMMAGSLGARTAEANDAWSARQVYIALGVFLTSAAMMGVDACPMEGFDPAKYDEILGLTAKGYGSVVLATAGYRSADDKTALAAKVRYETAELIEHI